MVVLQHDDQVGQGLVADGLGHPEVDAGVGGDGRHGDEVDVLDEERPHPAGDDGRHGLGDTVDGGERGQKGGVVLGPGVEAEGDLGHQGQGALGPHDELGQVVAARRLHEPAAGADDLAGAEHHLEAQDVVAGHAVLDGPHPAGVGGDVATEAGRLLAGEHRVDQPVGDEGRVQSGQGHPGLDHGHVVGRVDLEDAVHPLEGHHHAALDRPAAPGQPGARSARGERNPLGPGRPDDGRHLVGGPRPHHGPGPDGQLAERLVVGVVVVHPLAQVDVVGTDRGHQHVVDHGR